MKQALKGLRGLAVAVGLAILVQGLGTVALGPMADAQLGDVTATTAVNIRSAPSTSGTRLAVLYEGQSLPSLGAEDGWTEVSYKGRSAYIASAYLKGGTASSGPSSETSNGTSTSATGTVYTTANLNLRSGPSLSDSVRVVAQRGTALGLTGKVSGDYAQVTYKGNTYWGAKRYLSATAADAYQDLPEVTGKGRATVALMIRTTDTSNFVNMGDVPAGTILDTTGVVSNGVAQIVYNGAVRWVNARYLVPVSDSTDTPTVPETPKTTTRYATTALNIWTASSGSGNVGEVPRGSAIEVTGLVENGRAQAVVTGALRWFTARYLSAEAPAGQSTTTKYATTTLNIWTGSSGSGNVGEVTKGTAIQVTGKTENTRAEAIHNGATRWFTARFLSSTRPVSTTTKYATTTLNIWTGSSGSGNVGEVTKGTAIQVTGKTENTRAEAIHNGATRWFTARFLSSTRPVSTTTKYATTTLNIWTGSSGSGNVGEVTKGTAIQVTGKTDNGRAEAIHNGATRWFTARFLSSTKPVSTTTKYSTTVLNKWTASTGSDHDGEIAKGTAIEATGKEANGRVQAIVDGGTFWFTASYVSSVSPDESLNHGYSSGLDQTNAYVQAIVRDVWDRYPAITTMYGWRRDVTPDHPAGRAVDIMLPSYASNQALGWEIAKYYQAHAREYNINYIIFAQRIWNIERDSEGWRWMADRGSDNANHYNHIHITTYDE